MVVDGPGGNGDTLPTIHSVRYRVAKQFDTDVGIPHLLVPVENSNSLFGYSVGQIKPCALSVGRP